MKYGFVECSMTFVFWQVLQLINKVTDSVLIYLSSGQGRGGAFNRPRGGGGRGPRRGRGGRGRGGRTGEKVSAEDLDAELEKYHATAETMQE